MQFSSIAMTFISVHIADSFLLQKQNVYFIEGVHIDAKYLLVLVDIDIQHEYKGRQSSTKEKY